MRRKTALLLGLLLTFALTLPVQSQTPTAGPCGLPSSRTTWTSSTAQTTWNMTSDCTFSTSGNYYLRINSGSFIVNGNGYTIYSDPDARAFHIASGGSLEIRNVTIRGLNEASREVIRAYGNLTARDVTIRNNTTNGAIEVAGAGVQATLTNMRFLNNTGDGATGYSALGVSAGATVTLHNAIITGNNGAGYVVAVYANTSTLTITGCLTMASNVGTNLARHASQGTLNNNSIGACVGGGFTTATPTPLAGTATAIAAMTETAEAEGTATAAAADTATAEAEGTATAAAAMPGTATAAAVAAGTATAEAEMTGTAEAAETATAAGTATVLAMTATSTPTATPTPEPRTSKKKAKDPPRPTPTATPRPAYAASYTALQTETGMTFEAAYGLDSGVHFRQLDGGGIGVQSIIDAGPLAALDVYGYVEQGVEVCFPQIGRVIFLDARTMPRAITTLPATVRDGMTCVYLNSPGSLVLLPN